MLIAGAQIKIQHEAKAACPEPQDKPPKPAALSHSPVRCNADPKEPTSKPGAEL